MYGLLVHDNDSDAAWYMKDGKVVLYERQIDALEAAAELNTNSSTPYYLAAMYAEG